MRGCVCKDYLLNDITRRVLSIIITNEQNVYTREIILYLWLLFGLTKAVNGLLPNSSVSKVETWTYIIVIYCVTIKNNLYCYL